MRGIAYTPAPVRHPTRRRPPPRAPSVLGPLLLLAPLGACGDASGDPTRDDAGGADRGPCPGPACPDAGRDGGAPEEDAGPAPLALGETCPSDERCGSGLCAPDPDGAPVCSVACGSNEGCATPTRCVLFTRDLDGAPGDDAWEARCLTTGNTDDQRAVRCRSSSSCRSGLCFDGQCTVPCEGDDDCLTGRVCRELAPDPAIPDTVRVCAYEELGEEEVRVDRFPLTAEELPPNAPGEARIVAVPDDAVSVTFLLERPIDAPGTLAFSRVLAPGGGPVLDFAQIFLLRDQPLRWLARGGLEQAALVVPNTTEDRLRLIPGRWAASPIVFGGIADAPVPVELVAEVKRAPGGEVLAGTLDLDVYLVGVGLTPADAPADPTLNAALDRAAELFATVGITLGEIRYRSVPEDAEERLAIIDSADGGDAELAELFRLGEGPGPRLDVFLVRDLVDRSAITLGISGGIPGPPTHGAGPSGVALVFDPVESDADAAGRVLAHEIGHYLGLYHVREAGPPCAEGTDDDPPGCSPFGSEDVLADTPRTGPDARANVMFFSLLDDGNRVFTEGQGFVVRRHPLVR